MDVWNKSYKGRSLLHLYADTASGTVMLGIWKSAKSITPKAKTRWRSDSWTFGVITQIPKYQVWLSPLQIYLHRDAVRSCALAEMNNNLINQTIVIWSCIVWYKTGGWLPYKNNYNNYLRWMYHSGIGAVFIIYFRIILIRFFFRLKEARWKSGIEWFFLNQTENNKLN